MQVRLLGSSIGTPDARQYALTILINDKVAFDAGSLGYLSPPSKQREISSVFLSHSHIDHIGSLPVFLDNVYTPDSSCPTVYASPFVENALKTHFFNDVVWPDLLALSTDEVPFLTMHSLESGMTIEVDNLRVTPIELDHLVPTFGFIVDDGDASVGIFCDTHPTQEFWERINQQTNLRAVFVETSFPNSMRWLADKAKHLTPEMLAGELTKLHHDVPLIAIHIKPTFYDEIVAELAALGNAQLLPCVPNHTYEF